MISKYSMTKYFTVLSIVDDLILKIFFKCLITMCLQKLI